MMIKTLLTPLLFAVLLYAAKEKPTEKPTDKLTLVTAAMNPPYELRYTKLDNGNKVGFNIHFLSSKQKKGKIDQEELASILNDLNGYIYDSFTTSGPSLAKEQHKRVKFQDLHFYQKAIIPGKSDKIDILLFHDERQEKGNAFLKELLQKQDHQEHGNSRMYKGDILLYGKLTNRQWKKFAQYFSKGYKEGAFQKASMGIYNAYDGASVFDYLKLQPEDFDDKNYEKISKDIENIAIKLLNKAFTNGVPGTHKTVTFTDTNKEGKISTANMVQDATGGF